MIVEPGDRGYDDHRPKPEPGHGEEEDREGPCAEIEPRVGLHRADDADGQSHEQRHYDSEYPNLSRHRAAANDYLGHSVASEHALAKRAGSDVLHPVRVLNGVGVSQAQVFDVPVAGRLRQILEALHAEDDGHRVSRNDPHDQEDNDGDTKDGGHRQQKPSSDVLLQPTCPASGAHGIPETAEHPHLNPLPSRERRCLFSPWNETTVSGRFGRPETVVYLSAASYLSSQA